MNDVRRFACTLCGKCCNRSPEVELSEAAALADAFVFRLMFRLYRLPRVPERGASAELFYEKKRLLAAHAARKYPKKVLRGGRPVEVVNYLMISALALDTSPGACAALSGNRCSIHGRRPLGCRTVPFHYSRAEGLAVSDFDAFVATPAYGCDTSEGAGLVLQDGRIVDTQTLQARADALALAERDRPWKEAIVGRMKNSGNDALPSLQDLEANAASAAMTTSMRIGWGVAVDSGLLSRDVHRELIGRQLGTIERELARIGSTAADRETLDEMRIEYGQALRPNRHSPLC
jgi:Fe-S-cluster containining protein